MERTYLIQTLEEPVTNPRMTLVNKAFGGGMLQMSDTLWELLEPICSVRYMGAAEFESGALPKCLGHLANANKDLVDFEIVIKGKDIKPNYAKESALQDLRRKELAAAKLEGKRAKRQKIPADLTPKDATVYVICFAVDAAAVEERIRSLAKDNILLKRGEGFQTALDQDVPYDAKAKGWVDIENNFLFFIDAVMWKKMSEFLRSFVHQEEGEESNAS